MCRSCLLTKNGLKLFDLAGVLEDRSHQSEYHASKMSLIELLLVLRIRGVAVMPSEGAGVDVDADVASNRNHRVCQSVAELSKLARLIESIKVARMVRIVRASRSVQKRLKRLDRRPDYC